MKKKIKEIIRVDQAGELGAIKIYEGQLAVLRNKSISKELNEMLEKEKKHFETFNKLILQYRVRPTALSPIWKIGGFGLGAITAIMGEKATMACTEAVEEVIISHYEKQYKYLKGKDEKLRKITSKFCKEEKEHLNISKSYDTGKDFFHKNLKSSIKMISKIAIKLSEKI